MGTQTPAELIDQYIVLIAAEKRRIQESLQNIAEYSERLTKATDQMRKELA